MLPGGNPGPNANAQGIAAPEVGLIVKFDKASGVSGSDELGRNWNNGVRFTLPDNDVFAIDANARSDADRSRTPASAPRSSTWS